MGNRRVGDKVRLINPKSVYWFTGPHMRDEPMSITGVIVEIDHERYLGDRNTEYLVKFDGDGRESWYGYSEIRKEL